MWRKHPHGFTLLELLIVLAVIGLMSVFVVPRLTGSLGTLNQKTAARKICSVLRYARSQAVSEGVVLIASIDFQKGTLVVSNGPGKKAENGLDTMTPGGDSPDNRLSYQLPEGVYFEAADDPPEGENNGSRRIIFYPGGRTSGAQFKVVSEGKPPYAFWVDRVTGSVSVAN